MELRVYMVHVIHVLPNKTVLVNVTLVGRVNYVLMKSMNVTQIRVKMMRHVVINLMIFIVIVLRYRDNSVVNIVKNKSRVSNNHVGMGLYPVTTNRYRRFLILNVCVTKVG